MKIRFSLWKLFGARYAIQSICKPKNTLKTLRENCDSPYEQKQRTFEEIEIELITFLVAKVACFSCFLFTSDFELILKDRRESLLAYGNFMRIDMSFKRFAKSRRHPNRCGKNLSGADHRKK